MYRRAMLHAAPDVPATLANVPRAPRGLPLAGHIWQLLREPFRFLRSLHKIGDIVRVDIGVHPLYFVTDHEIVHQMLVTQAHSFEKGRLFERLRPLVGNGLMTTTGEFHRRQRLLIQPAFHHKRIAEYAHTMANNVREITESWRPDQQILVDEEMHKLALKIVIDALFSSQISACTVAEITRLLPIITSGLVTRALTPHFVNRLPIRKNREFDTAAAQLRATVDEVVKHHHGQNTDKADLLSILITSRDSNTNQAMSDTQLRDEAVTLLCAGSETTAATLAWALHELAYCPTAVSQIRAEVAEFVGDRIVSFSDLPKLPTIGRVLNETTRLHPLLVSTRSSIETVDIGGVRVPSGVDLAFSPHALHRDPRAFPAPDRFDPDRWLSDRTPSRHQHIPFGAGIHKCIGDTFSWTEMGIALATILPRFTLKPASDHRVQEAFAIQSHPNSLPMIVTRHG